MDIIKNYEDLKVWQKAITLADDIYEATQSFPKEEMFGLRQQLRRAAVSIPSNIAEGSARGTRKDFAQFISIARGSLAELQTQLIIAKNRQFIQEEAHNALKEKTVELSKMLRALLASLKNTH